MIFYVAIDENGHRQLCPTQADARAVNKQFEQIDIPVQKADLMAFVQDLFTQVDTVEAAPRAELASEGSSPSPPPPPAPRTTDDIEEMWPNLPLAFRFGLCAMTMEDARNTDFFGTTPAKAPQRYAKPG